MDLVIYGAQGIALGAYKAIHDLFPQRRVRCFLVTKYGENAKELFGLPVLELKVFVRSLAEEEKNNIEVLIATPESVMGDIERDLEEQGMHCRVRLTSLRWAELMGFHYVRNKKYVPLSALPPGFHEPKITLYMARFFKDKPLRNAFSLPEWVIPIQVGAARCSERVADVRDGENISAKNANYSELTALYWIWKNRLRRDIVHNTLYSDREYYGLSHYRRILEFSGDDIMKLVDNAIDVVLPYPMPYEPDIEEHHKRYLSDEEWNILLMVLKEQQPEYAEVFPEILKQQYFYNYNIILAHREILADYCKWLFPILERVDQICNPGGGRCDRYIGYVGESLETLYFMYNQDKLNIAHTGCRFLI